MYCEFELMKHDGYVLAVWRGRRGEGGIGHASIDKLRTIQDQWILSISRVCTVWVELHLYIVGDFG